MTLANKITAKLAVAFVAIAMMFSLVAPAQALTTAELQAQINTLMATINALQAQLGQSPAPAVSADAFVFTRSLTLGARGADVIALQNHLISAGFVIPAGATGFFGSQTTAAVSAWQAAHGVSPAVGFFGPVSQAKYNALMAAVVVVVDEAVEDEAVEDEAVEDEAVEDEEEAITLRGEADLSKFQTDSAADDEIEEGATNAEIAEVTIEFSNGDAEISRIDLALEGAEVDGGNSERDPWDVFETISLWIDGEMISEEYADDENDYLNDNDGSLRFTGLDIIALEDEELDLVVKATIQDNLRGVAGSNETWSVEFDSLRFFDADGVATTDSNTDDLGGNGETFTLIEEGADDEVIVKTSAQDPNSTTLQVETNKRSGWHHVFSFDLDTDDSENDIEFDTIVTTVTLSAGVTYDTIVNDAELVIDGVTISDVTIVGGIGTTAILTFDVDGDVKIDAGDREEAKLMLRFNSLASANEGITVTGSVTAANSALIDAEGADDLTVGQLSGSATGDAHTLRTQGIVTDMRSDSAVVTVGDLSDDDFVTFDIQVDVTAFEQDVFISTTHGTSLSFVIEDSAGDAITTGEQTVVLTSSATERAVGTGIDRASFFEINEGTTETLTLKVVFDPILTSGAGTASEPTVITPANARLRVTAIDFAETAITTPLTTHLTLPATDYRTDTVIIVN